MRTLLLALALSTGAVAPGLAHEDVRISTAGRDLSDPADVAALHAQIERAAKRICEPQERMTLDGFKLRAACIEEKVDKAVRTANLPALTALHASLKQPATRT